MREPFAGVYGVDKKAAYCFGAVQAEDHYTGCYLWPDADGTVKPHVSLRMVFGSASWPNRFERISLLDCVWVQHCQKRFDEQQPPPREARLWAQMRHSLQQDGKVPEGDTQLCPAGMWSHISMTSLAGRC